MHPIHPMSVHFPIALLSFSVLLELLSSRWRLSEDMCVASLYRLILGFTGAIQGSSIGVAWLLHAESSASRPRTQRPDELHAEPQA